MAPEHDARTRAFYDYESDDPSPRRRRAAADWGVGEDIFDRMPSRRFTRRSEHRDDGGFERRASSPATRDEWDEVRARRGDWADEHERRQVAPSGDDWNDEVPRAAEYGSPRFAREEGRRAGHGEARWNDAAPRGRVEVRTDDEVPRRGRRPAESWTDDIPAVTVEEGQRAVDSWLDPEPGKELALAPGESRTVVLEAPAPDVASGDREAEADEAPARRTVTITGHPDRMPVTRAQRPPRTALERIGASPDRIVGYAVAIGFLLVLIAVLTTGN